MANRPRGLVPHRTLNGGSHFAAQRFHVSSDNPTSLFPNDPVWMRGDGHVQKFTLADASAVAAQRGLLGVVRACYDSAGKPLTFSQPTKGPFLDASTEGYVDVVIDPDVTYVANCSVAPTQTDIGQYVAIAEGVYNSAAGISGIGINSGSVVASATGSESFQIINFGPSILAQPDQLVGVTANVDLEVRIADHMYRRSFSRTGHEV